MIKITIPERTPSINHLYFQRGYRRFIKKEAVKLKQRIKQLVELSNYNQDSQYLKDKPLMVEVLIYEDWRTKKGDIARKDIANREKFLIDSVFEALNLDDKQIFVHSLYKVQSDENKAVVVVEEWF